MSEEIILFDGWTTKRMVIPDDRPVVYTREPVPQAMQFDAFDAGPSVIPTIDTVWTWCGRDPNGVRIFMPDYLNDHSHLEGPDVER